MYVCTSSDQNDAKCNSCRGISLGTLNSTLIEIKLTVLRNDASGGIVKNDEEVQDADASQPCETFNAIKMELITK